MHAFRLSFLPPILGLLLAGRVAAQLVTTNADSGPGSLRQALLDAAAAPGPATIRFDATVFTGAGTTTNTIALSTPLAVNDAGGVTIDASDIATGVTLHGGQLTRLCTNAAGSQLVLVALNLTGGRSGNAPGGAILNQGGLELRACALYGHDAGTAVGGAMASQGAGNELLLINCTFTGNTAGAAAVALAGTTAVIVHCTIAFNQGTTASGGCGGLSVTAGSDVLLQNTILAANTAAGTSPPDLNGGSSTLNVVGTNLIGVRAGGFQNQLPAGTPNASGQYVGTVAMPLSPDLQPLGRTHGPTLGLEPRRTSLAVDRIGNPPVQTDQTGDARVERGLADIGALEARYVASEAAWDVCFSWKPGLGAGLAATAGATFSVSGATHLSYSAESIVFRDAGAPRAKAGYFPHRQRAWPIQGQTPDGQAGGNDSEFHLKARCHVTVAVEDDYTLGFASDDGGRLRIFSTDGGPHPKFTSSTALNPTHPTPVHDGNVLTHDGQTPFSDTLGVVHLLPGTYQLEFDYVQNAGASHAEVFAARGAKTALDASFRLIGEREDPLRLDPPRLTPAGWDLTVLRQGATSLADGIATLYDGNSGTFLPDAVMGLRFTSGMDHPERDPLTFLLEGALSPGVWVPVATGTTQIPSARQTRGPVIPVDNVARYQYLRITFPTLRDPLTATAVQVGEVEFLNPFGQNVFGASVPIQAVPSANLGTQGPAAALDLDPATMFVHPAGANAGFAVLPNTAYSNVVSVATAADVRLYDPENFTAGSGHGQSQTPFPGNRAGDDNYFTTCARGQVRIETAGDYTFCVEASGEVRLRVVGSRGWSALASGAGAATVLLDGFQCLGSVGDTLGQVRLQPGLYEIEVFFHANTGPANFGVWIASGRQVRFDARTARYFTPLSSTPLVAASESVPALPLARPPGATRPTNDDFANALELIGTRVEAAGSLVDATLEPNELDSLYPVRTVWWKWTAPVSGAFFIDTFGSECGTALTVCTGTSVDNLHFIDGRYFSDIGDRGAFPFLAVAGTTYYFQVAIREGEAPARVRLHLAPSTTPVNDNFADAIDLGSQSPVTAIGTIVNGTLEGAEGGMELVSSSTPAYSTWFLWTAPVSGKYLVDTRGGGYPADFGVFTGDTLETLVPRHEAGGYTDGAFHCVLNAVAGTTYRILVDYGNGDGNDPNYRLNIAFVGRHDLDSTTILEDEAVFLLTYLGDADYQRTTRVAAASSQPALLPPVLDPQLFYGVSYLGFAPVMGAGVAPLADQFGTVTYTHSLTFDRLPMKLSFTLDVTPVNDAPNFTAGPNLTTSNLYPRAVPGWASGISAGPANESGQTLNFSIVANSNPGLFAVAPVVALDGTLSYTPAATRTGTATLTLRLEDNGGTANGGQNRRERTFTITTTGSAYAAWAAGAFGSSVAKVGPNDDFDGDGLSNLTEYAFRFPPAAGTPPPVTPGGIQPQLPNFTGGTLRFTRWADPTAAGLTYAVEESADLVQWSPSSASPSVLAQDGDVQLVAYAVGTGGARRFYRVSVGLTTP